MKVGGEYRIPTEKIFPLSGKDKPIPANVAEPELYRAAQGFEAYFARYLLEMMRGQSNLFGKSSPGTDIYQGLFTQALGEEIAGTGSLGIAEMIYRQITEEQGIDPWVTRDVNARRKIDPRIERYTAPIVRAAERHHVDPDLIRAVIKQESNGERNAVSDKGAKGLMQLVDSTAAEMGVNNPFDPIENIDGGTAYLRKQIDRFKDIELALAAYNAGPGAVERHGGIPPFRETRNYVESVMTHYKKFQRERLFNTTSDAGKVREGENG